MIFFPLDLLHPMTPVERLRPCRSLNTDKPLDIIERTKAGQLLSYNPPIIIMSSSIPQVAAKKRGRRELLKYQANQKVLANADYTGPIQWSVNDVAACHLITEAEAGLPLNPNCAPCDPAEAKERATGFLSAELEVINGDWPWIGCPLKLLLQAPFATNERNFNGHSEFFALPEALQTSRLFRMADVQCKLVELLFRHHSTAAMFSSTCQTAFWQIATFINHWDITRSEFCGADFDDAKKYPEISPTVGSTVVSLQSPPWWILRRLKHEAIC
jgi:hypothetical protein